MRLNFLLLAVLVFALALAGFPAAHAQETGGSMGGADFSSGGGSDSGSSSSSDAGSYAGSSDGGGSSSGGGGDAGVFFWFCGGLLLLFLVMAPFAKRESSSPVSTGEPMSLSVLVLGIDWHARSALQKKLAALAARKLGATAEGRVTMLREVVLELSRAELSWLYVAYEETPGLAPSAAEAELHAASSKARSRFRRELIRNEGGELTTEETGPVAIRPEEGAGTVVVSLILVTRRPLAGQAGMSNAAEIRVALADRSALIREDLVAIEVVWSPAAEDDRMSTAELEQHYPELVLIDPESIAGRLFCSYCGGVFAMELLNCPHCGGAVDRGA